MERYAIQARPQRYKDMQTATGILCTRQQIVANRYYGHTQAAFSGTTSRYIMRCHVVFSVAQLMPEHPEFSMASNSSGD